MVPWGYADVPYNAVMGIIYITGSAGSGKSTVKRELLSRGYEAFDVDEDGFKVLVQQVV
jgi:dephospho-CoA kinase